MCELEALCRRIRGLTFAAPLAHRVACCSMNTAGWAGAYCFVCAIFILWTWMIVMQAREGLPI